MGLFLRESDPVRDKEAVLAGEFSSGQIICLITSNGNCKIFNNATHD
jgi:hypothetical protein